MSINRVQVLRFGATGDRPLGKKPGELFVNFADLQIGAVNATAAAQDLIAVRFFSTQAAYPAGTYVVQANLLYRAAVGISPGAFNPAQWSLLDPTGLYLPLTGGTLTGDLTAPNLHLTQSLFLNGPLFSNSVATFAGGSINLNGVSGSNRFIVGWTLGVNRWQLMLGDASAEGVGVSNSGSNFSLTAFDDSGNTLSTPLAINRATGLVTVANAPQAPLGVATKGYVDTAVASGVAAAPYLPLVGGTLTGPLTGVGASFTGMSLSGTLSGTAVTLGTGTYQGGTFAASGLALPTLQLDKTATGGAASRLIGSRSNANRWELDLGDGSAESTGNAGSDFVITRYADGGGSLGNPLAINRATGVTTIASLSAPGLQNDNRVINGNFLVNQRLYVSNTALTAGAFGHDRWKAGASGCTYTYTQAPTQTDNTITITAGSLLQVIEALFIEGGVFTLSWTGTAKARVYQGGATGTYVSSPLITSALASGTNTTIDFNAGTLGLVKFESGAAATPFNRYSLAKVVTDCQRYYQRWTDTIGGGMVSVRGYANAAAQYVGCTMAISPMRATPTVTAVGSFTQINVSFVGFWSAPFTLAIGVQSNTSGSVAWYSGVNSYLEFTGCEL